MKLHYLLSFLLFLSILFNFFLWEKAIGYYKKVNAIRLDPIGCKTIHLEDISYASEGTKIMLFGDSRIEQWSAPKINGYIFINLGVGGQTSEQVYRRFKEQIDSVKPDIVIIQVGINDLKNIGLFPQKETEIIQNCKTNIKMLVEDAQKRNISVILTTLFPLGEPSLQRKLFYSNNIEKALLNINNFIHTLQDHSVYIFDTYALLTHNNKKLFYLKDFLHINHDGYHTINIQLAKILQNIKEKSIISSKGNP